MDLIRRNIPACNGWILPGEPVSNTYLNIDGLLRSENPTSSWKARIILRRAAVPLVKTHLLPDYTRLHMPEVYGGTLAAEWVRWLERKGTFVYVVRDGRDVLCSYHLFASRFDKSAKRGLGEFLRSRVNDRNRVEIWAHHVRTWLARPETTVLRFEDILARPRVSLSRLEDAIGARVVLKSPALPEPFRSRREARLARLSFRPRATTTIGRPSGTVRKHWRDLLSKKDIDFFRHEAGDVLAELGYAPT